MASNTNNNNYSGAIRREQMNDSNSDASSRPSSESNMDVILEVCQCQRCVQELDLNGNNPSYILMNNVIICINEVEAETLMAAQGLIMFANGGRDEQMNSSLGNNAMRDENNVNSFTEASDNVTRRENNRAYETILNIRRNRPRTMPLPRILRDRGVRNSSSLQNSSSVTQGNNSRFHIGSISTSGTGNTDHMNQGS